MEIDKVKVIERENKPAVIRIYQTGPDPILVEDRKTKKVYIKLDGHLSNIKDEADRNVEEAEIKKAVKWYTE